MWEQSPSYWAILGAANLPVYLVAGWVLYGSWQAFVQNLRFSFTPEVISFLRGEWSQRWGAEFKLLTYLGACGLIVMLEHVGLSKLGVLPGA